MVEEEEEPAPKGEEEEEPEGEEVELRGLKLRKSPLLRKRLKRSLPLSPTSFLHPSLSALLVVLLWKVSSSYTSFFILQNCCLNFYHNLTNNFSFSSF